MDEDLVFLFADSEHTAVVGSNGPVQVLYDAPTKPVHLYEDQVDNSAPACSILDQDVERLGIQYETPLAIQKNGVTIGNFTVSAADPDGAGLTRITLTFAEA